MPARISPLQALRHHLEARAAATYRNAHPLGVRGVSQGTWQPCQWQDYEHPASDGQGQARGTASLATSRPGPLVSRTKPQTTTLRRRLSGPAPSLPSGHVCQLLLMVRPAKWGA